MVMTTISIKEETWQKLMGRKKRPSHTFDDIINELMEVKE